MRAKFVVVFAIVMSFAIAAHAASTPRYGVGSALSVKQPAVTASSPISSPTATPTANPTQTLTKVLEPSMNISPTPSSTPSGPAATSTSPDVEVAKSAKGVASSRYIWRDVPKLSALNVSWTYGWSPWVPASKPALDSVPMVANASDATDMVIRSLTRSAKAGDHTALLGFNEPDNVNQANMTPEQAIALWPKLESTGLRLGSPAPAVASDGWLDKFMSLATEHGDRVDFITLHFYVDFTDPDATAAIMKTVDSVYAKYHKPVWITEIGALDIRTWGEPMQSAPTDQFAIAFMRRTIAAFDNDSAVVERYAWFTDTSTVAQNATSCLYDASGSLTPLGQAFTNTQ